MKRPQPSILIIDDNSLFIERMILLLQEVSIQLIDTATDYQEGLNKFESGKPDLVLLDINLPGKNGVDLLKKIRQTDKTCKIIMLSNHASDYYRRICMSLGVSHFLDKSNEFGLVSDIINEMNFN